MRINCVTSEAGACVRCPASLSKTEPFISQTGPVTCRRLPPTPLLSVLVSVFILRPQLPERGQYRRGKF